MPTPEELSDAELEAILARRRAKKAGASSILSDINKLPDKTSATAEKWWEKYPLAEEPDAEKRARRDALKQQVLSEIDSLPAKPESAVDAPFLPPPKRDPWAAFPDVTANENITNKPGTTVRGHTFEEWKPKFKKPAEPEQPPPQKPRVEVRAMGTDLSKPSGWQGPGVERERQKMAEEQNRLVSQMDPVMVKSLTDLSEHYRDTLGVKQGEASRLAYKEAQRLAEMPDHLRGGKTVIELIDETMKRERDERVAGWRPQYKEETTKEKFVKATAGPLAKIGHIASTPAEYLAGAVNTLVTGDPIKRRSWQQVIAAMDPAKKYVDDAGRMALGQSLDMILDPLQVAGVGAITKAGKAAAMMNAATKGLVGAERMAFIAKLAAGTGEAADAARLVLDRVADEAGLLKTVNERSLLSLGGDVHLAPLVPPVSLPEFTVGAGAKIFDKIGDASRAVGDLGPVKAVREAFTGTPEEIAMKEARRHAEGVRDVRAALNDLAASGTVPPEELARLAREYDEVLPMTGAEKEAAKQVMGGAAKSADAQVQKAAMFQAGIGDGPTMPQRFYTEPLNQGIEQIERELAATQAKRTAGVVFTPSELKDMRAKVKADAADAAMLADEFGYVDQKRIPELGRPDEQIIYGNQVERLSDAQLTKMNARPLGEYPLKPLQTLEEAAYQADLTRPSAAAFSGPLSGRKPTATLQSLGEAAAGYDASLETAARDAVLGDALKTQARDLKSAAEFQAGRTPGRAMPTEFRPPLPFEVPAKPAAKTLAASESAASRAAVPGVGRPASAPGIDSLTGVPGSNDTRATLLAAVNDPDARVFFFDIDKFKAINDVLGHHVGDQVLAKMGQLLREHFPGSKIGRYGGEEFSVILKPGEEARAVEFMNRVPAELKINGDAVTISGGIKAGGKVGPSGRLEHLNADDLLYEAKRNGRNQLAIDKAGRTEFVQGISVGEKSYVREFSKRQLAENAAELLKYSDSLAPEVRDSLERAVRAVNGTGKAGIQGAGDSAAAGARAADASTGAAGRAAAVTPDIPHGPSLFESISKNKATAGTQIAAIQEAADAGLPIEIAEKHVARAIPADTSPEAAAKLFAALHDAVRQGKGGKVTSTAERAKRFAEVADVAESLRNFMDARHAEMKSLLGSPTLIDDELAHVPHLPTPEAAKAFADPQFVAAFKKRLNEKRAAAGKPPLDFQTSTPSADTRLANMDSGWRGVLEKAGLAEMFLGSTAQGSMKTRKYRASIQELNDVAEDLGVKKLFQDDPVELLRHQEARRIEAMTRVDFVDQLVKGKVVREVVAPAAQDALPFHPGKVFSQEGAANALNVAEAAPSKVAPINPLSVEAIAEASKPRVLSSAPVPDEPGVMRVKLSDGTEGYMPQAAQMAGRAVVAPNLAAARAFNNTFRTLTNPREASMLLRLYMAGTGILKSSLTRVFPGFHASNDLSNLIQASLFEGVPPIGKHMNIAADIAAGRGGVWTIGGKKMTTHDVLLQAKKAGLSDDSLFYNDVAQFAHGKASTWNPLKSDNYWFDTAKAALDPNNKLVRGMEHAAASVAMAPSAAIRGSINTMKDAASSIAARDVAGLGRALNAPKRAYDFVMRTSGKSVEYQTKLATFIHKLDMGYTPRGAAAAADRALFDYSRRSLSSFERGDGAGALGIFAPANSVLFYGYVRNILPRMAETILNNPRALAPYLKIANRNADYAAPDFVREGLNIPLGEPDERGDMRVLHSLRTPVESAMEPVTAASKGPEGMLRYVGGALNPMLRWPIEAATGSDIRTGRPIEQQNKAPAWLSLPFMPAEVQKAAGMEVKRKNGEEVVTMDPNIAYVLRQPPFSRASSTASSLADERKEFADSLLGVLTGANIVEVNPAKQERADAKREREKKREERKEETRNRKIDRRHEND